MNWNRGCEPDTDVLQNQTQMFYSVITDKIDNIRNTITNVDSTASSTSASFIAPKEKLQCFTTIEQDELNKLITASKPTTCSLDPVPTKLLIELLPVAEEPLLNIINSSLFLGHIPKPFKLAVIKPLIKKQKLDPCELANLISNLPFMSKILENSCVCSTVLLLAKKWYQWRISINVYVLLWEVTKVPGVMVRCPNTLGSAHCNTQCWPLYVADLYFYK